MIGTALTKIFGSKNERVLKQIQPLVERINSFEADIQKLDDEALAAQTVALGNPWMICCPKPLL